MGKPEKPRSRGVVTAIFVNTEEGAETLRRLEARIEKAKREGKIIPPEKRRYPHQVSDEEGEDDSSE
jgi:hypothetical protein